MKRVVALLAVGALAPMIQGVAGTFVPARYCPDLSLLLVIGLGLYWRSTAGGALLAATFGFIADLLSGSLFGHHALLRLLGFGTARVFSRQLNLHGRLPQITFVVVFTVANALVGAFLTVFFAAGPGVEFAQFRDLLPHSLVNAVAAVPTVRVVDRLASWLSDEPGRQRLVLEPRSRIT